VPDRSDIFPQEGPPTIKLTLYNLFATIRWPRLDEHPAVLDQLLVTPANKSFSFSDEILQLYAQLTGVPMRRVYAIDSHIQLSVMRFQLG
jgi:hypothetical protein